MSDKTPNIIRLPLSRLSFPKISELQYGEDDTEKKWGKYNFNLISTDALAELKKACQAAAVEKFKDKAKALFQKGTLKMPYKDGEMMVNESTGDRYDGYEGDCTAVSVNFYEPMPFLDQYKNRYRSNGSMQKKDGDSWVDAEGGVRTEEVFYGGCYVDVFVTVHAYDQGGGKGVNLRCYGLMKREEGEKFGGVGFGDTEDLFGDVDAADGEAPTADSGGTSTDTDWD